MSDLAERLIAAAEDKIAFRYEIRRAPYELSDALANELGRVAAAAVLRELATGYQESAAAWVSRESHEQKRIDLRVAQQISRLANEIEATPSTSDPDGSEAR